jgi:shikimate dehydrogenase
VTVSGRTRVFALLGDPVGHSVSPRMQNAAFTVLGLDAVYVALRASVAALPNLMRSLAEAGGGGNVTVPHKVAAAGAVDRMQGPLVGACNVFWSDGQELIGDNSDVAGVLAGLHALGAPASDWLVVGAGGSTLAVLAAARERGARVLVRSRDGARAAAMQETGRTMGVEPADPGACEVIINATPLGLAPSDPLPLEPAELPGGRCALDLVYRAGETRWVRAWRDSGRQAADGREVLVAQGAVALERWFPDRRAPVEVMRAAVRAALG